MTHRADRPLRSDPSERSGPSPPAPPRRICGAEPGVAVWQTETGELEGGSLDDFVRSRRRRALRSPRDREALRDLGRAYLWSGDPDRALDVLAPLHRARPSDREVQSLILDALSLLGHAPDAYPWVEPPTLVPLDAALLDRLHERLADECRPATALDLCLAAADDGHPAFEVVELVRALQDDRRFLVHPSNLAPECAVVLARRSDATGQRLRRIER